MVLGTFPETNAIIIARGGQNLAKDVPGDTPNITVMILKLRYKFNSEFGETTDCFCAVPVARRKIKTLEKIW